MAPERPRQVNDQVFWPSSCFVRDRACALITSEFLVFEAWAKEGLAARARGETDLQEEGSRADRAFLEDCNGVRRTHLVIRLKRMLLIAAHLTAATQRSNSWSLHRPGMEVMVCALPTRDWPGHHHAFTVATPRRLEPLGRRQAQHLPVRVIATCGASWLLACLVSHTVTEVEISIVHFVHRVIAMDSPGSIGAVGGTGTPCSTTPFL